MKDGLHIAVWVGHQTFAFFIFVLAQGQSEVIDNVCACARDRV
jgi:hypothetical protein